MFLKGRAPWLKAAFHTDAIGQSDNQAIGQVPVARAPECQSAIACRGGVGFGLR